jgi:hypothetical protein
LRRCKRPVSKPSGQRTGNFFYETVNIGGGQYAHNPWLQEMPDPVNRTVWGNYLSIPVEWDGVNKIKRLENLNDGDNVEVEVNGQKLTCTVVRTFGQWPGTVAIALGGGREMLAAAVLVLASMSIPGFLKSDGRLDTILCHRCQSVANRQAR